MVTASHNLTDAEIDLELVRLNQPYPHGFIYFLKQYVYIEDRKFVHGSSDPITTTIRWQWWPVHQQMVMDLLERLIIILKARQIGWSWLTAAYVLYNGLFNRNYLGLELSQGQREADELLRKSHFIYNHLPEWLQPGLSKDNNSMMEIKVTQSMLQSFPSTERAGASFTGSLVLNDEAAHHPLAAENFVGYSPAISAGGQHILMSTAYGWGNLFEKMYHAAKKGLSPYKYRFYSWRSRPGRDEAWYAQEHLSFIAAGKEERFKQEHPDTDEEAFLVSGRPRFKPEVMLRGMENAKEPIEIPQELRHIPGLSIWKLPIPGHPYVMGSDPAEGLAHGDASVTQVLHARNLEHVATIKGQFEPAYFTQITAELGMYYNRALWGWERNNHGHVMTRVATVELLYPRCCEFQDKESTQHQRQEGLKPTERYGFQTTSQSRPGLLDDLAAVLDTENLQSPSLSFWEECRTFIIDDNGVARGATGACDDEVMAMGIARRVQMQPGAQSMRETGRHTPAPSLVYRGGR